MDQPRKPSRLAIKLLGTMLSAPGEWRHGYDLARETGLQSGTLYPLLMRLADEGLLEAEWQPAAREGRPARHAYRLTPTGIAVANAAVALEDGSRRGAGLAPA
jgi:DNA-binding PadR family transcriptional regulator